MGGTSRQLFAKIKVGDDERFYVTFRGGDAATIEPGSADHAALKVIIDGARARSEPSQQRLEYKRRQAEIEAIEQEREAIQQRLDDARRGLEVELVAVDARLDNARKGLDQFRVENRTR